MYVEPKFRQAILKRLAMGNIKKGKQFQKICDSKVKPLEKIHCLFSANAQVSDLRQYFFANGRRLAFYEISEIASSRNNC